MRCFDRRVDQPSDFETGNAELTGDLRFRLLSDKVPAGCESRLNPLKRTLRHLGSRSRAS